MSYKEVVKKDFEKYFLVYQNDNSYELKYNYARKRIKVQIPFKLDENVSSLMGMMPDGSLIKDLRRAYFSQKKDISKIFLFKNLVENLFGIKVNLRQGNNCYDAYFNSKTLARFFYHVLKLPKSDEPMRIPRWIFNSPKSVIISYLRQAFDMEGTVLKSLREIRFITKDKDFAYDLKELLCNLSIKSTVNTRIGGIHKTIQYRLSIYGRDNFSRFRDIGFRVPNNMLRFRDLLIKYDLDYSSNIVLGT